MHSELEAQQIMPSVEQGSSPSHSNEVSFSEHANPPNGTCADASNIANRKSRIALACKRCKRRKQRCDGSRPSCQACDKVRQQCSYERSPRPQYPGGKARYISVLEERIAFLEARIPGHAEDHFDSISERDQQIPRSTSENTAPKIHSRRGSLRISHASSLTEDVDLDIGIDDGTSLVDGVAYLSLCASGTTNANREPFYVGSSSGATIARVIQSSIYRRPAKRPASWVESHSNNAVPQTPDPSDTQSAVDSSASITPFPGRVKARMLYNFFFETIHPRWPLLDRLRYEAIFDKQYIPGALSITEISIVHLIYAITARFLAVTRKPCGIDDEAHLSAATRSMEHILHQHDLDTVQYLILLGVHGQRSPYGAGAWAQVRYATSICIEMGLHRKRHPSTSPAYSRESELRRRAFWSCYCLDRVIGVVLGRPFAVADRDINVELPCTRPEFWTLTHKGEHDSTTGPWSNVLPFIHIIKLDRIHSRIHKTVFRVDKDVVRASFGEQTKLDQKITKLRADLDEWVSTCPQTPKYNNKSTWMYDPESAFLDARDFYSVQYHKAVLFLFTVFLPVLETSDPRFITCAHSAASVCNAYKRLSQNKTLTYTMISLHSCFVAGLTLIYCIWRDRKLFSYEVVEATQSCSQILTIFGEKWPGAVKYRDIFDALSQSLFKLTLKPLEASSPTMNPLIGQIGCNKQSAVAGHDLTVANEPKVPESSKTSQPGKPTMSHLVTDAVKDAFMEVDEEAPGGWQGWRMWNEMVIDSSNPASRSSAGLDSFVSQQFMDAEWDSAGGIYGIDPVQDAAMQWGNGQPMNHGQWTLSDYR